MPDSLPLVQLQLIVPLLKALKARDIDPGAVLESVGLTRSAVDNPESSVHVMVIHQFLQKCAEATSDKTFCSEVGAGLDTTGWPMIQKAMSEAKTLGEFLTIYVMQSSQVASSVTSFLNIQGVRAEFGEHRKFKPLIVPAQNDGFMISLKLSLIERAVGAVWDPSQVILTLSDPGVLSKNMSRIKALKGDDMGSKVQFPSAWLNAPLSIFAPQDEKISSEIKVADSDFLTGFRALLRQQVPNGGISVNDAANLVHLNARTLSRRLAKFGTTTAKEILAAKMEYAQEALKTSDQKTEEIALDLGYSDPSNFSRAFVKYVGKSPSRYRTLKR
ncbi:AraC family transcriptional regulator [Shimia thalassica]|uniref:helix-turn-helix domain-containing protein n=1 Tax=Shimia thalassica TaxID=1715693 RepID=UPI0026E24FCD|nr:AraC family transcriptional regulator [Shimia thalassica]MDO6477993.1 AraC family transcriptional regulator [Shimia thalassica]MDO6522156.1 AraC family transcriptional regulator [Shimia thalassica]